ncbi:hypothetical protein BW36_00475 [Micrococcus luteus]|uniref:DUF6318 family protein n=1 Tax=Micrococcus luteus TaxID=1270 RepID=UPI000449A644|nr:DUF6318 family protein [Micrococcus luteus]EZP43386.1 hypothetical protein BW36_00475 [Micrococcus luteus]
MSLTAPGRALRRHRFAQAGTLSVALALTLTACGGQSEPAESSTTSPSSAKPAVETSAPASTSETAGVSSSPAAKTSGSGEYVPASADGPAQNVPKPKMPAAMKEETKEGAEAAIRYFWDVHYYAEQTGDTELLDSLYSEYCEFCQFSSNDLQMIYKDGGWYTGTEVQIDSILTHRSETGYVSTLLVTTGTGTGYTKGGVVPENGDVEAASKQPWIAEVSFNPESSHWIVDEMSYEGSIGSN